MVTSLVINLVIHIYPHLKMTFQHFTVPVLSGHCSFFAHISIHLIVFLLNRLVSQEFIYYFLIICFYYFELCLFRKTFYDI